ncbi:hypothetical protein V5P93_004454 [Actinokineospora auranticolor]|uniref:DUF4367 domain-containing protein n=1 Tax=Actinokineospora auranticolor TaxID=155976 RepID=A0A2S6GTC6_9PSEU|nr:hypothetical protein [Actinokineospora auranticolor]PPK68439.1 hypothetical protein CLV40_105162 [Actinokineospora auranticolor]
MPESDDTQLCRDLVDLGRALDRPAPQGAVEAVLARLARRERRPHRRVIPMGFGLAAAAVAVVAVLQASSHLAAPLRDDPLIPGTDPANPTDQEAAPIETQPMGAPDGCSTWMAMEPVPRNRLSFETNWTPPSTPAWGEPNSFYTRRTRGSSTIAMARYSFQPNTVNLERYPPNMVPTYNPRESESPATVDVAGHGGRWARATPHRAFQLQVRIVDPGGREVDRLTTLCGGSRLTWTVEDGTTYAISGPVPDETLLALAATVK